MHSEVSDGVLWAGAIAIVLSAAIAAGVTIWRTRALLGAEADRLNQQLDGEAERLDRQLAHARAMSEREELRSVIDETIKTVQQGIYAVIALQSMIDLAVIHQVIDERDVQRERDRADLASRELNGLQSRLAVRLPATAALLAAIETCRVKLSTARLLAVSAWPESSRDDRQELQGSVAELEDAGTALEGAARILVESELTDS